MPDDSGQGVEMSRLACILAIPWSQECAPDKYLMIAVWLLSFFSVFLLLFGILQVSMRHAENGVRDRILAQQKERERIEFEAHDTLVQNLQGLILLFQSVSTQIPLDSRALTQVDSALTRAERVLEMDRDLLSGRLPPLDLKEGLPEHQNIDSRPS